MRWRVRWLGVLVLLLPVWVGAAEVSIRDAETGLGLDGVVVYRLLDEPVVPVAEQIDELLSQAAHRQVVAVQGRGRLDLDRPAAVRVEVPGYQPLHAVLRPSADNQGWSFMLDPLTRPSLPVASRADHVRIQGWVVDADSLLPIADARVGVAAGDVQARSDERGHFQFEIPAPVSVHDQPVPLVLHVSADGFPDWASDALLLGSGGFSTSIYLGSRRQQASTHRQLQQDYPGPGMEDGRRLSLPVDRSGGDVPPASLVVGFADANCTEVCGRPNCQNACSHSCVFSLETYVRRGLPNEWIASWSFDALAAGAVAYRSYGAWHAFNPLPEGSWDVCSSVCCQVNRPGTHVNTNAAQAATAGLMLIRNGAVFRSEYASQNNCLVGELSCTNVDISCGDGFVGSPNAGWPCLADPISQGRPCFGHGRGMSQWGNQLWAQASPPRRWAEQLAHYYNASGQGSDLRTASVSQVLAIEAVRVSPVAAGPGGRLTLELDVVNHAAEPHSAVMIGASLRQSGGPFIDDAANDQSVQLPPGPSTVSRVFDLPSGLPDGEYSVYLSLFIDVDGNQLISGEDLRQDLVIVPAAVSIRQGLFWDRFESPR